MCNGKWWREHRWVTSSFFVVVVVVFLFPFTDLKSGCAEFYRLIQQVSNLSPKWTFLQHKSEKAQKGSLKKDMAAFQNPCEQSSLSNEVFTSQSSLPHLCLLNITVIWSVSVLQWFCDTNDRTQSEHSVLNFIFLLYEELSKLVFIYASKVRTSPKYYNILFCVSPACIEPIYASVWWLQIIITVTHAVTLKNMFLFILSVPSTWKQFVLLKYTSTRFTVGF